MPENRSGINRCGHRNNKRKNAHAETGRRDSDVKALGDLRNDADHTHFGVDDAEDAERQNGDQKRFGDGLGLH